MKKYRSRTKIIVLVVLVCGVLLSLFIVNAILFTQGKPNTVEKYDTVKIDYTVWESNSLRTYDTLNPLFDDILWVTIVPITENDTIGLILGLYNNLLGKRMHYESDLIWLDKCIDENRDGIDDITNATALSYGNSTDQYYNTCLMIQFQVLDIKKGPETQENTLDLSGLAQFFQTCAKITHTVFKTMLILEIILPILLLSTVILSVFIYDFFDRHQINVRKMIFKYGLMIGICSAIPFIVFGIINLTLTPEEFYLLKTRYDFFLNLIISLIVLCCLVFIVIYLLIWKSRKGK